MSTTMMNEDSPRQSHDEIPHDEPTLAGGRADGRPVGMTSNESCHSELIHEVIGVSIPSWRICPGVCRTE